MEKSIYIIFIASAIYFVDALLECLNGSYEHYEGFAVTVGLVSEVVTGLLIFLRVIKQTNVLEGKSKFISLFLFVWWLVGAAVGTFEGPFEKVGNGYFAGWTAFLLSTQYAFNSVGRSKDFFAPSGHMERSAMPDESASV